MDKEKIVELENYLFSVMKEGVAGETMAGIIGVLIGVKPVMAGDFGEKELEKADLTEFMELINSLRLKVLFFNRSLFTGNGFKTIEYFYVSKDYKTAKQAHEAFLKLWSTMDDMGQEIEPEEWKRTTKRIGEILGYPKTAISNFIKEDYDDSEERRERMERNRYYIHSPKHEEKEFKTYDLKINKAISEYAPKTAELFLKNEKNAF